MTDKPGPGAMTVDVAAVGHDRCGGDTGHGPCGQRAGWGTPHVGVGRCKLHGGNTPTHVKSAAAAKARAAVAALGLPREVDPHTALLEEVHRCAGAVEWLGLVVGQIEDKSLVWGEARSVTDGNGTQVVSQAGVNTWVRLWQDERDRLVRVSKTAIDAGVDVRRVELEQARVSMQAAGVRAGMDALGLGEEQRQVFVRAMLAQLRVEGDEVAS